ISRLLFQSLSSSSTATYRLNVGFFDQTPDSIDPAIPAQYFRFESDTGISDVASTSWIGSDVIGQRTGLSFTASLLDVPSIPLAVIGIEVRTRLKVEPIPHWQDYQNY